MIKQFLYVWVMSSVSVLCVDAMYSRVTRLHAPVCRANKRAIITSSLYYEIKAVGLAQCMQAGGNEECQSPLCCRDIFSTEKTTAIQQKNEDKKSFILKKIDQDEGRLAFLRKIQHAYNELTRIQRCATAVSDVDEDELRYLIAHQKTCLRNQLRLIQEDSPQLLLVSKISYKINEKDKLIIEEPVSVFQKKMAE